MTSLLLSLACLAVIGSGSILKGVVKLLFFIFFFLPLFFIALGGMTNGA